MDRALPVQRLFIHGRYVDAQSGQTFESINPANGLPIATIQQAGAADVERAVKSSEEGFAAWSQMTGAERGRILMRAVQLLRQRNRELAELEVADTGKPIQEAIEVDVLSGADCIEYFAGLAASLAGQHIQLKQAFAYTRREPLGVCAGIGAWNYPIQIACWKSGPALACGNAMIFKPAEQTPLTALKLAEIYKEAGVPDGVFNVVQGGASTGELLVSHPRIAKVSFTGSVPVGKRVMANAAGTLKKVTMELGGKSPLIVFADADLESAVSAAMLANFYTQGEVCTNGTRVYVEQEILDVFLSRLVERTRRLRLGNPMDPATQIGALISAGHRDDVLSFIEAGKREGATLLCGGKPPADPALASGFYVEPTIFTAATDDLGIVREEIFGPVMTVLSFTGEDEVIHRANDTPYGLAAGVFTRDIARAHRVVGRLEAGVCWINNYNVTPVEVPFGGSKQSGIGRENGAAAIDHYTQLKSVYVELGKVACPYD
uniref:Betaine-aldehyde dehydrogenase n=1 Tax=uncultured bacterium 1114 TaxID=548901 RepID=B8R952_9BACT|nr:putative betaine aldehyde dehydrogenase [uncultured bacterium 1114]